MNLMARSKKFQTLTRPLAKAREPLDADGMPRDDRNEALGWYLRKRLLQMKDLGHTQTELATRAGTSQPNISNVMKYGSAGIDSLLAVSKLLGQTPGQVLDDALEWWTKRGGRLEALEAAEEVARERRAQLTEHRQEAAPKPKKKRAAR
jgi:hypothetical protein